MPLKMLDTFKQILTNIRPYVKKTPLLRCKALEEELHASYRIFLKLENEQPTHSFKVRGAFNALLSLAPQDRGKGVVTRSSGNFAQAIAYAGNLLNVKTRIVMPTNAPKMKKEATQRYGVEVTFAGTTHEEGNAMVEKIKLETGAALLSPYNHLDVMQGQGTIALEIFEELPTVRYFFCPIGGGGLMGGCATVCKLLNPDIETIGIEPEGAADYYLSRLYPNNLKNRHRGPNADSSGCLGIHGSALSCTPNTICDGLRAPQVGALNRPLLDRYVDTVSTVSDLSVMKAMKFLKDHYDLVIEPSGAAAFSGFLHHKPSLQGDVVCVLSGGNVDPDTFEKCMNA
jgi:threonine dehydratase